MWEEFLACITIHIALFYAYLTLIFDSKVMMAIETFVIIYAVFVIIMQALFKLWTTFIETERHVHVTSHNADYKYIWPWPFPPMPQRWNHDLKPHKRPYTLWSISCSYDEKITIVREGYWP